MRCPRLGDQYGQTSEVHSSQKRTEGLHRASASALTLGNGGRGSSVNAEADAWCVYALNAIFSVYLRYSRWKSNQATDFYLQNNSFICSLFFKSNVTTRVQFPTTRLIYKCITKEIFRSWTLATPSICVSVSISINVRLMFEIRCDTDVWCGLYRCKSIWTITCVNADADAWRRQTLRPCSHKQM